MTLMFLQQVFRHAPVKKLHNMQYLYAEKHGIDLSKFTTTNISDVNFDDGDLVLTATKSAKEKIKRLYPNIDAFTIKEYSGQYDDSDINDPSDDSLGEHVVRFFEIYEVLEKIIEKLNFKDV